MNASADFAYDRAPAVLVLGTDERAIGRGSRTVVGVGARPIGGANPSISEQVHARAVWVELTGGDEDAAAALLDAARRGAESGRWSAVIAAPRAHLDLAAAHAAHSKVDVVIGDDPLERAAALQLALAAMADDGTPMLHERSARAEEERLRRLTAEVGRIAHTLARISGETLESERPRPAQAHEGAPAPAAETVRAMVRARRLRAQFFDSELFADPAWDMLLDLYAARLDQHRVAVSSLCIASAVPATTALRWIKTLTDRGLFVRRADPTDGRRVFIELADDAANAMAAYFVELERMAGGTPWRGAAAAV